MITVVKESEKPLAELRKKTVDLKMFREGLRKFTDMKELTLLIVNKLIERIKEKGVTTFY